ncbi:7-carboxy-7-deazaguanine synthase [Pokkaliibacter plantistimulans]|uniref:7-carboxy-7-deazaguanine synthase n=1 Tax=Proteobacteria bacterium 228 TaxID=2083153 RepID=A0A2S5KHP1_9PROT|nr:7-carboxy-7-deazaguanine synthase [Pokkaliibacter plantistimulans]PPC74113.1 7-carboxy-7-deazaguanine synthase [Pokkaliibacter plantistimulans]
MAGKKRYQIKEAFYTLQGEGAHSGRPAVFCRFTGCNLWSGKEKHRATAVCQFCDTDFIGTDGQNGGQFDSADALARHIHGLWPITTEGQKYVVCTGGEPLLQLDPTLIEAFHQLGFEIAIESNGTLAAPAGIDWICISPKADAELQQLTGHELKLVYPQLLAMPERFTHLDFQHFYLQPMDGPDREANTRAAIAYCLAHPQWRLSLQTHKYLGID